MGLDWDWLGLDDVTFSQQHGCEVAQSPWPFTFHAHVYIFQILRCREIITYLNLSALPLSPVSSPHLRCLLSPPDTPSPPSLLLALLSPRPLSSPLILQSSPQSLTFFTHPLPPHLSILCLVSPSSLFHHQACEPWRCGVQFYKWDSTFVLIT